MLSKILPFAQNLRVDLGRSLYHAILRQRLRDREHGLSVELTGQCLRRSNWSA